MNTGRRTIHIDREVLRRLASWCHANEVTADSLVEELLADLPEVARPDRVRASQAVTPVEERVIPHAELVRRLVADREANALGDAGGMIPTDVGGGERSLVGPAEGTREVCHVHGWVGRHRFEADNHAACDPAGDTCLGCDGVGWRATGSLGCDRCKGSGIEPPAVVFDETQPQRKPDKVQHEMRGPSQVNGVRIRRRRDRPRAKVFATKRFTREELRTGALLYPPVDGFERPRTRAECPTQRPCPFVSCKHHLYLDVNPETGSIKLNFPDLEVDEIEHSCALDAADLGAHTLEAAAEKMNITRERLRQIEVKAYFAIKPMLEAAGVDGAEGASAIGNAPEDAA